MYILIAVMCCLAVFSLYKVNPSDNIASVIKIAYSSLIPPTTSTSQIYKILLVPGHEPKDGGTRYGDFYERNLAVTLAQDLADELRKNQNFEIEVARDNNSWNSNLSTYFITNKKTVSDFIDNSYKINKTLIAKGSITTTENYHNNATPEAVNHLFAINHYVNNNDIDLVVHIHFNDDGLRKSYKLPGKNTGMNIYIPDHQYSSGTTSRAIAEKVFPELNKLLATSTHRQEAAGIVEDQGLIATGAYNTLTKPSLLIEYGYIYEKYFREKVSREAFVKKLAEATSLGINNYFLQIK